MGSARFGHQGKTWTRTKLETVPDRFMFDVVFVGLLVSQSEELRCYSGEIEAEYVSDRSVPVVGSFDLEKG